MAPVTDADTIVVLGSGNARHSPGRQGVDAQDRKPVPATKSKENLQDGWQLLTFSGIERHTGYSLVKEGDAVVVKAVSDQSASGLTRAVSIDQVEYPVIQWRWKVNNVLQKGDVTSKDGDDYPARVYISFAFDPDRASYLERLENEAVRLIQGEDVPYRAISYIWGSNSPVGTMTENSYTDRAMMFVVQAGSERLQQWVMERRNVYGDIVFRKKQDKP